jgi:hypothetical protein
MRMVDRHPKSIPVGEFTGLIMLEKLSLIVPPRFMPDEILREDKAISTSEANQASISRLRIEAQPELMPMREQAAVALGEALDSLSPTVGDRR